MKKLLLMQRLVRILVCLLIFLPGYGSGRMVVDPGGGGGPTYTDILFWWTCESENIGAGDYSAGDTIGTVIGGAVFNATAVKLGTNGLSIPTIEDRVTFSVAASDIINESNGRVGFWIYFTQWAATTFIFDVTLTGGRIRLYTSGTDELTFDYGLVYKSAASVDANLVIDTWYFVEIAWNAATETQKIFVDGVEKGTNVQAKDAPTVASVVIIGNLISSTGYFYMDNVIISNDPARNLYLLKDTDNYPG